jgi:hypothetical protein
MNAGEIRVPHRVRRTAALWSVVVGTITILVLERVGWPHQATARHVVEVLVVAYYGASAIMRLRFGPLWVKGPRTLPGFLLLFAAAIAIFSVLFTVAGPYLR